MDYLIYTYEVVKNINESYPLPILIGGMLLLVVLTIWLFKSKGVFKKAFGATTTFRQKLVPTLIALVLVSFYSGTIENEDAEISNNRYNNELSKAGIYSFLRLLETMSSAIRNSIGPYLNRKHLPWLRNV